jgi:hypothetical protein
MNPVAATATRRCNWLCCIPETDDNDMLMRAATAERDRHFSKRWYRGVGPTSSKGLDRRHPPDPPELETAPTPQADDDVVPAHDELPRSLHDDGEPREEEKQNTNFCRTKYPAITLDSNLAYAQEVSTTRSFCARCRSRSQLLQHVNHTNQHALLLLLLAHVTSILNALGRNSHARVIIRLQEHQHLRRPQRWRDEPPTSRTVLPYNLHNPCVLSHPQ